MATKNLAAIVAGGVSQDENEKRAIYKKLAKEDSPAEPGDGENSIVQKGSNAVAFGENSVALGTSSTNAKDRGITEESTNDEIIEEWENSDPESDKFALVKGEGALIEGNNNLALGKNSHAEGNGTIASDNSSHAEGTGSQALGKYSHAEGLETIAEGRASHSEGLHTVASGPSAHAEGEDTIASEDCSHAEGYNNKVYEGAGSSHVEGSGTEVRNSREHAQGSYNVSHTVSNNHGFNNNPQKTVHSVGIGTSNSNRKNAFEIMQNGDAYLLGVGGYDGTNPSGATPINQLIGQGGGSALQITGTYESNDNKFTCTSGHSVEDVKDALLAGIPVVVNVVMNPEEPDSTRFITSDISVTYDSGTWYAHSKTFATGVIDSWVVL